MFGSVLPSELEFTEFFDALPERDDASEGLTIFVIKDSPVFDVEFAVNEVTLSVGIRFTLANGDLILRVEHEGLKSISLFDGSPRWLDARFDSESSFSKLKLSLGVTPLVEFSSLVR